MTMNDAMVIGIGSLTLLIVFVTIALVRASGTFDVWAILRRYVVVHMSTSAEDEPVPAAVPVPVPVHGTGTNTIDLPFLGRNLTEAQYIELGARLVDRRGKYVYSGKTLYKIAGGSHDEFLSMMRRWRGGDEAIEEQPAHVTPIVGRKTNAVFETDQDFPYQAPA